MDFSSLNIGLLALQGDYELHEAQLDSLNVTHRRVKLPGDLIGLDGLIMPGGESTTMNILIDRFGLREPIKQFCGEKPTYATCAGMILLATSIKNNQAGIEPFGLIDLEVIRNGYGRQVNSFDADIEIDLRKNEMVDPDMRRFEKKMTISASFIRAPRVVSAGKEVERLARFNGDPVLLRQKNILASTFHAETGSGNGLLRFFLYRFFV